MMASTSDVSEAPSAALVFFPPPRWSKRFGPDFFTVRFLGWKAEAAFDQFRIEVELGEDELGGAGQSGASGAAREVFRRYSEFLQLRGDLIAQGLPVTESEADAPFPPKAFWRNRDSRFLEARCDALRDWMYALLKNEQFVACQTVRDFLELAPVAAQCLSD
mmetsp:Transcript_21022/g.59800  ORF Transcript_21022/g.59800 Transcript_21022/m.59800 type:complete len:162 (-) Transcript_21022:293-778(-)